MNAFMLALLIKYHGKGDESSQLPRIESATNHHRAQIRERLSPTRLGRNFPNRWDAGMKCHHDLPVHFLAIVLAIL
jgi:hypothetical protein